MCEYAHVIMSTAFNYLYTFIGRCMSTLCLLMLLHVHVSNLWTWRTADPKAPGVTERSSWERKRQLLPLEDIRGGLESGLNQHWTFALRCTFQICNNTVWLPNGCVRLDWKLFYRVRARSLAVGSFLRLVYLQYLISINGTCHSVLYREPK